MISSNHPSKWSTMHSTVEAKYENLRKKNTKIPRVLTIHRLVGKHVHIDGSAGCNFNALIL
jgi:hypothetical protein